MDPIGLILVVITLLASAVFAALETALLSIPPARVRALVDSHTKGASFLKKLKDDQHKTLITIVLINNFLNIGASAYTTVVLTRAFGAAGLGIATLIMTIVILIFGEIIPKTIASSHSKEILLSLALPVYLLKTILSPLVWLFDAIVQGVFKLAGLKKQKNVSDEELIAMVSIGEEEGSIEKNEKEIIENALHFNEIRVEEIMTPRVHIDAMPEEYDLKEAGDFMVNHSHTRIPVYRDTIDNIVGIVTYRELLENLRGGDMNKTLRQINLLPPLKIAASMLIDDLFLLFNKQRRMMAIVLDEHGGTAGLITMEDLLEELVGEIVDESDKEEEDIKKISEHEFEVSGKLQLEELVELTGLKLKYPEHKTVNYLIIEELGALPKKDQHFKIGDWEFTVLQLHRNTILKVRVKKTSSVHSK